METESFQDLITRRNQWVLSSRQNNFDFDSILAGIYNDPSHFIYEILQNAEDAGATEISFNLFSSHLEIRHNGKDFNFRDVDGITGIGISTKKDDINRIGKFGVGFKSVFAVTKSPIIHSGIFHFKIEDFVIPHEVLDGKVENTLIVLPFNHPIRSQKEVFETIRKKLEGLDLKTLLFLNYIKQIKWVTPTRYGEYCRQTRKINNYKNVFRTWIKSDTDQEKMEEKYLVFAKPIFLDSQNLNVEVAFRIGSDVKKRDSIVPEKDSKLFAFFPTEKVTFLNFLIQGMYKTTPNRENIPLDDPQNQFIISETAKLVADSIKIIKELGLLSTSFLELLPIDPNRSNEAIYSTMFQKIRETLSSSEKLLPTSNHDFTTAQNALLARSKELTDLLNENDLSILFNKRAWLDSNITIDRTRQLRDYLIGELGIKEIDFENFAVNVSEQFMKGKSDEWMITFYEKLLNQRSLWEKNNKYLRNEGILRRKPIIRLSDEDHVNPCNRNDSIQVYLPSITNSEYKTVKGSLIENANSLKFLTELGLSNPDIFSEIKEFIIPKYKNPKDIDTTEYYEDIKKLLIAFGKANSENWKEIFSEIKELSIVFSRDSLTGEQYLVTPKETYLPTPELIEYFNESDPVYFLSDEFDEFLADQKDALWKLLMSLGCENKPRRISIEPSLSADEKLILRKQTYQSKFSQELYTNDYDYEGLDNFLKDLNFEKSIRLWNFLIQSIDSFENWDKESFFKGEYCWLYYSSYSQHFEARFLKTLKNTQWLYAEDGCAVRPNEISISQLSGSYKKNSESVKILVNILEFQIDEIKSIQEKTGKKVLLLDPLDAEAVQEFLKLRRGDLESDADSTLTGEWEHEIEPEEIVPTSEILEPDFIETTDLSGQRPNDFQDDKVAEKQNQNPSINDRKKLSKTQLNQIGNWGERLVYKHLKETYSGNIYIKVLWQNSDENIGIGYDFSILKNGKEIEYIEVKSRVDGSPQLVEITGTQWEFARELYNKNKGEMYSIYVVSNTGTVDAKISIIKNPVKLWKEGKLYAHPVNLKL